MQRCVVWFPPRPLTEGLMVVSVDLGSMNFCCDLLQYELLSISASMADFVSEWRSIPSSHRSCRTSLTRTAMHIPRRVRVSTSTATLWSSWLRDKNRHFKDAWCAYAGISRETASSFVLSYLVHFLLCYWGSTCRNLLKEVLHYSHFNWRDLYSQILLRDGQWSHMGC